MVPLLIERISSETGVLRDSPLSSTIQRTRIRLRRTKRDLPLLESMQNFDDTRRSCKRNVRSPAMSFAGRGKPLLSVQYWTAGGVGEWQKSHY
jgi:hypothetical protein